MTLSDFLSHLKEIRKEGGMKHHNLSAPALQNLVMVGAFDSLFEEKPSVSQRIAFIRDMNKALQSKAALSVSKKGDLGLADVHDELTRNIWISQSYPLHVFNLCDHYSKTLDMMGYKPTGSENIRFIKSDSRSGTGDVPIDVLKNFSALFGEKSMAVYTNKNFRRLPAIVALYNGHNFQSFGAGKKMIKIKLHDGSQESEAIVWPEYNTNAEFPQKLMMSLNNTPKNTPCLVIGKLSANKNFKSFQVLELIPFI